MQIGVVVEDHVDNEVEDLAWLVPLHTLTVCVSRLKSVRGHSGGPCAERAM